MVNLLVYLFVLLVVIAAALMIRRFASAHSTRTHRPPHYAPVSSLLTPTESAFYRHLMACNMPAHICPKVRLADVLKVPAGMDSSTRRCSFLKISQKHVDFVMIDPNSYHPVLVIELDDSSHNRADRKARDAFVDAALKSAGLPVLHYPAKGRYTVPAIKAAIAEVFPQ